MVAIVTGASDGIGKRTARLLCQNGYTVYGLARTKPGGCTHGYAVDVADKAALTEVLDDIYAREQGVDLVVQCAGVSLASPAELTTDADARYLFDVNFWGCVYTTSYVLHRMKKVRHGRILIVSSLTGLLPIPYLSYYGSSKAALLNWAAAASAEAAQFGVDISVLAPGGVRTGFTRKRKKYTAYEDDPRAPGLRKAIAVISAIEQGGTKADTVARKLVWLANSPKQPPVVSTVGLPNHAILALKHILPAAALLFMLRRVFTV